MKVAINVNPMLLKLVVRTISSSFLFLKVSNFSFTVTAIKIIIVDASAFRKKAFHSGTFHSLDKRHLYIKYINNQITVFFLGGKTYM